ncbi:alpha/beta hydrolase [Lysinibacillus yapensis]|uniref:Alpha/beta hydrolase n=2 Tax=Ureibacillus yapensis TaxID=2304605 RepID=A0A396S888_9BACL|nr:alpha/beta hydrolase [Lysinibacillus yapensis]
MLIAIVALLVVWVIFSNIMTFYEKGKYPAIGQLVEVDGNNMHVYTKGNGDHTIVLLSGHGTAAPALDFEPLINEMAKNNKVVVIEPFGYGWSDITNKDRTVENIVAEIRTALKKLNIQGPYILMPHSISGIYSMYYANTYPEEVKAIIGIDPTLPKALKYFGETAPTMPQYFGYVAPTGIARLALYLTPDNFLPIAEEGTYSEENLDRTKAISAWKGNNRNVVSEANEIRSNINKTVDMKFPSNMPVLIFTTKKDRVTEEDKNLVTFYEAQLTNYPASKIVTLEGHHYLHWTRYKEMSKEISEFTESISLN